MKAVRRAVKARDTAAMTQSADTLEALLTDLHVADAPYRPDAPQNPEASDDAMDAEFESVDE